MASVNKFSPCPDCGQELHYVDRWKCGSARNPDTGKVTYRAAACYEKELAQIRALYSKAIYAAQLSISALTLVRKDPNVKLEGTTRGQVDAALAIASQAGFHVADASNPSTENKAAPVLVPSLSRGIWACPWPWTAWSKVVFVNGFPSRRMALHTNGTLAAAEVACVRDRTYSWHALIAAPTSSSLKKVRSIGRARSWRAAMRAAEVSIWAQVHLSGESLDITNPGFARSPEADDGTS